MKKVGIITLYSNNNFGAALQAYALQYSLKKNGFDCEDINYRRDMPTASRNNYIINILHRVRMLVFHPAFKYYRKEKKKIFDRFIKENISESHLVYDKRSIKDSVDKYRLFICGSDNIWNKNLLDTSFLLDFVPDSVGKIAYAPGMSTTSLTKEQAEIMIPLINRLDFLSCREKIGCELLKTYNISEPFHAMDPTLLLSSDIWEQMIKQTKVNISGDYIFLLFMVILMQSVNL